MEWRFALLQKNVLGQSKVYKKCAALRGRIVYRTEFTCNRERRVCSLRKLTPKESFTKPAALPAEEALGLASDAQMAVERGLLDKLPQWFGFLVIIEPASGSISPVEVPKVMPFPATPILTGASDIEWYRILFDRMDAEGNYDAVALITSDAGTADFDEPSGALLLVNFESVIRARISYIKVLPDETFDKLIDAWPTPNA